MRRSVTQITTAERGATLGNHDAEHRAELVKKMIWHCSLLHCVIGRVNDMPTLPTGEGGDSTETMRGRVASLGAPYQLPVESPGLGGPKRIRHCSPCIALSAA